MFIISELELPLKEVVPDTTELSEALFTLAEPEPTDITSPSASLNFATSIFEDAETFICPSYGREFP